MNLSIFLNDKSFIFLLFSFTCNFLQSHFDTFISGLVDFELILVFVFVVLQIFLHSIIALIVCFFLVASLQLIELKKQEFLVFLSLKSKFQVGRLFRRPISWKSINFVFGFNLTQTHFTISPKQLDYFEWVNPVCFYSLRKVVFMLLFSFPITWMIFAISKLSLSRLCIYRNLPCFNLTIAIIWKYTNTIILLVICVVWK